MNWTDCAQLYQRVLTDDGVCFTFNMFNWNDIYRDEYVFWLDVLKHEYVWTKPLLLLLYPIPRISDHFHSHPTAGNSSITKWSLDNGFDGGQETVYPRRSYHTDVGAGLVTIMRHYDEDTDKICRAPFQGYKLFLHSPNEPPNHLRHFQNIRISLEQYVMVGVMPHVVTTSDGLRGYDAQRRQCYYNSERYLRYFKAYTQSNCELECLANYTLTHCGCVRFSMPRKLEHQNDQILIRNVQETVQLICRQSIYTHLWHP